MGVTDGNRGQDLRVSGLYHMKPTYSAPQSADATKDPLITTAAVYTAPGQEPKTTVSRCIQANALADPPYTTSPLHSQKLT